MGYLKLDSVLSSLQVGTSHLKQQANMSPGQSLPHFPPPKHGSPPLPPYVSIADAIFDIHPNDPLHVLRPFSTARRSDIDPYLPLPGTIMASQNSHFIFPDGTRPFTKREIARFQTFSDAHIFGMTRLDKQSINTFELEVTM
jgi:site-specific DNA-cytosine methylase